MSSKQLDELARPPALMRKAEVAQALGISIWTVERWLKAGQFPKPIFVSDGAPARWRTRDVELWIEQKRRTRRRRAAHPGRRNLVPTSRRRSGRERAEP